MASLADLLATRPTFTLDELAAAANAHLPAPSAGDARDARVKATVNPRLVRHYVGEALLDPPLREGRHALYTVDHLLQLLALRRLLAHGVTAHAIGTWLRDQEHDALLALARGDAGPAGAPNAPGDPPPGPTGPGRPAPRLG
ncbi:MAG: MerR family transcriptional regulator, partial [Trueperaceae bacterium]|nr:MerR family transcriptional regulator [Trueperaceae bacterium]